jgi:hypothetical protein
MDVLFFASDRVNCVIWDLSPPERAYEGGTGIRAFPQI